MKNFALLSAILILAFATIACSFSVNLPDIKTIETGPTVTTDIMVPLPDSSGTPKLEINFGAGELNIQPGAESGLAAGTATYNVPEFAPKIVQDGSTVKLQQGEGRIDGLPNFGNEMVMEWDLELSDTPMEMELNGGANQTRAELGGLSFVDMVINQGAADSEFSFSEPNLVEMSNMQVNAGAANVNLYGIGNANITDGFIFKGGAGNYTLDFSGELQQDLYVTIDAGLGNLILVVPDGTPAELTLEGALTNVNTTGSWQKSGNSYNTSGSGYMIYLDVTMGAGNLDLRN
ncbi:MAG: toast rack family protein [Anaerolineales bacterium]